MCSKCNGRFMRVENSLSENESLKISSAFLYGLQSIFA